MTKLFITGYYGCSCHPFENWKQCNQAHKQNFSIGDPVQNIHNGKRGEIHSIEGNFFYTVKYGPQRSDIELEHSARLMNPIL